MKGGTEKWERQKGEMMKEKRWSKEREIGKSWRKRKAEGRECVQGGNEKWERQKGETTKEKKKGRKA